MRTRARKHPQEYLFRNFVNLPIFLRAAHDFAFEHGHVLTIARRCRPLSGTKSPKGTAARSRAERQARARSGEECTRCDDTSSQRARFPPGDARTKCSSNPPLPLSKAINSIVQGSAADVMKRAMLGAHRLLAKLNARAGVKARLVLQVGL